MSYEAMKRYGGNLSAYYLLKEANLKGGMLYDSNSMTLWKRQNYADSKKTNGFQELKKRKGY